MAEIIYPAAFGHAPRRVVAEACQAASSGTLSTMRAAAGRSADALDAIDHELAVIDQAGRDMEHEAEDVRAASQDIGFQMDRLIAEAHRMADFLRNGG